MEVIAGLANMRARNYSLQVRPVWDRLGNINLVYFLSTCSVQTFLPFTEDFTIWHFDQFATTPSRCGRCGIGWETYSGAFKLVLSYLFPFNVL
jgi:hypothetical protein